MNCIQDIFASNVRKYRKAKGLSQEKLAELACLHRTYIGGIEQRRVNVSLKNVGKIAAALDVDPALLFLAESAVERDGSADDNGREPRRPSRVSNGKARGGSSKDRFDYALVAWDGDRTVMHPIKVPYEDLTVKILCNLIREGYQGDELVRQYDKTSNEIIRFIETSF